MKATIANYTGTHKEKHTNKMIAIVEGINSKEDTKKVIGKTLVWTSSSGKKIEGKITQSHGCKGAVKVLFSEKGLPGQAIGQKVEVE